ncbi:hypothetical protein CLSAP_31270 [Clostridium saccharoperbutylacetonicum]|nr:hypothetical protein CLSAP_31270 [Clostridium saccharoperbutylacetonicum]NSB31674.1 hypothetical protein [Clostridium saccharoperbutylacetonicum]
MNANRIFTTFIKSNIFYYSSVKPHKRYAI